MIPNPASCLSQVDMPPTRALALALLVMDEHIELMPIPATPKARQATWEWLTEVRAPRRRIAKMIEELNSQNGHAK